jgi:hypothetical protein
MVEPDNIRDIYDQLKDIRARVDKLVRDYEMLESAFTRDEDSDKPDYAGHRIFHKNQFKKVEEEHESIEVLKRNIITWLAIGALTVVGTTLAQVFVQPAILNVVK